MLHTLHHFPRRAGIARLALLLLGGMLLVTATARCEEAADGVLESLKGDLSAAERTIQEVGHTHPDDDQARFGLGILQFIQGVERLGQSLHRFGARTPTSLLPLLWGGGTGIPILRMPVPQNKDPEEMTSEDLRQLLDRFGKDLMQAEATLSEINDSDVKLRLHFGGIRLDLDGDGVATEQEMLWRLYMMIASGCPIRNRRE